MAFLPALAIGLSAVGAGVSFIGGMQQAKAAEAISAQNASIQQQNAAMQAQSLRAQAELQRIQATANARLRGTEAAAQFGNAEAMKQRAAVQEQINAANLRKQREEGQRLTATQRARFAAAGVVESTGSPLSLLAETAGIIQRDLGERQYQNELALSGLYQEAALERLGGEYALAGATLDKSSALSQARLTDASATATLLTGQRQAEITRLAGASQASGLRTGAFGNLLSAGAGLYGQARQLQQLGAY